MFYVIKAKHSYQQCPEKQIDLLIFINGVLTIILFISISFEIEFTVNNKFSHKQWLKLNDEFSLNVKMLWTARIPWLVGLMKNVTKILGFSSFLWPSCKTEVQGACAGRVQR